MIGQFSSGGGGSSPPVPVLEEAAAEAEAETFKVEVSGETVALSRRELQARYLALSRIADLSELSGDKVVWESTDHAHG